MPPPESPVSPQQFIVNRYPTSQSVSSLMSHKGQSGRFDRGSATSGLPRGTDIVRPLRHDGKVPNCDIVSFDHFVGAQDKVRQDLKAVLFPSRSMIDDKLEPARLGQSPELVPCNILT